MPLPKGLGRFNRVITNRLMRPWARLVPGFGVLRHVGRTTGRSYETPLNVFEHGDRLVVALTYGEEVDWLKNVRAAGEATFVIGGVFVRVGRPIDIPPEDGIEVLPAPVRAVVRALDVSGFVAFPITD